MDPTLAVHPIPQTGAAKSPKTKTRVQDRELEYSLFFNVPDIERISELEILEIFVIGLPIAPS